MARSPIRAVRKKHTAMRISELLRSSVLPALVAVAIFGAVGQAMAFDDKVFDDKTGVKPQSSPWAVFQFGFSAYKSGHKEQAVEAYKYAAENGQIGATWKLARMYAEGDGVARDDYEAFKFFSEIVDQDVEPGSPEESYVSDALVALGDYLRKGIPGSPVTENEVAAQEYYMRAAANYRNPNAQFEMGQMFLKGEGGVKASVKQAGRWFQLAAEKGHAGAQATLGHLLFQSGKIVRGLAMMTAALERASPADQPWIRGMQEEAFAAAGEADRRTAISLADDILTKGGNATSRALTVDAGLTKGQIGFDLDQFSVGSVGTMLGAGVEIGVTCEMRRHRVFRAAIPDLCPRGVVEHHVAAGEMALVGNRQAGDLADLDTIFHWPGIPERQEPLQARPWQMPGRSDKGQFGWSWEPRPP